MVGVGRREERGRRMRRNRTKERGVGGWRMEGRVIRSWMYGFIIADGGFSQGHI